MGILTPVAAQTTPRPRAQSSRLEAGEGVVSRGNVSGFCGIEQTNTPDLLLQEGLENNPPEPWLGFVSSDLATAFPSPSHASSELRPFLQLSSIFK